MGVKGITPSSEIILSGEVPQMNSDELTNGYISLENSHIARKVRNLFKKLSKKEE